LSVVIPDVVNNFFALAINGIQEVAEAKGYHVLIYLSHEDLQKEIPITRHLQSGRVDGVLISVSKETENIDHIKRLQKKILR
jgi:LacI family transcriptional regulator